MRTTPLRGTKVFWLAQSREDARDIFGFRSRKEAVHFVDHRVEGWDGWTVYQCSAFAKTAPKETVNERG